MQAFRKEALPLFGSLESEEGKGIDCDVARVHLLPDLGFRPAWKSAEHQGRPSNAPLLSRSPEDKGPRSDKVITEIKAGCEDSRVTPLVNCLPTIVALNPGITPPRENPYLNSTKDSELPIQCFVVAPSHLKPPRSRAIGTLLVSLLVRNGVISLSILVSLFLFPLYTSQIHMPQLGGSGKSQAFRMKTILPCSVATCYPLLPLLVRGIK